MSNDCLVFPAHAGVFLRRKGAKMQLECLPRARGGVSQYRDECRQENKSSPRTRGCFRGGAEVTIPLEVFPAHAGVFLSMERCKILKGCLPRARGGVSNFGSCYDKSKRSSPRTRGCFHIVLIGFVILLVFPAHAGVFLTLYSERNEDTRLPRARGGVSQ